MSFNTPILDSSFFRRRMELPSIKEAVSLPSISTGVTNININQTTSHEGMKSVHRSAGFRIVNPFASIRQFQFMEITFSAIVFPENNMGGVFP